MDMNQDKTRLAEIASVDLMTELTDRLKKAQAMCDEASGDNIKAEKCASKMRAINPALSELINCIADYIRSTVKILEQQRTEAIERLKALEGRSK